MPRVYWTNTKSQRLERVRIPCYNGGSTVSKKTAAVEATSQTIINSNSCYVHLILMLSTLILTPCYTSKHSYRELSAWGFALRGFRHAGPHLGSDLTASRAFLVGGWKHHVRFCSKGGMQEGGEAKWPRSCSAVYKYRQISPAAFWVLERWNHGLRQTFVGFVWLWFRAFSDLLIS